MRKEIQTIIPGVGIGTLKFGLTKDEVESLVGPPDDIDFVPDMEGDVNESLESWHYDSHEFSRFLMRILTGEWSLLQSVIRFSPFSAITLSGWIRRR
ncbi:MAG: hypothetical protein IPM26_09355 [Saprospiraceae bacterium]|nr:hypothetical protein [Saprospiraceae bacterium]